MTDSKNKKPLVEAGLIAAITSFFIIGTLYIPMLSMALIMLPVPFILLSVRHGTRYTIFSLIITSLLIGFLTGVFYTVFIFVISTPIALIMGYSIKKKKKPYEVVGWGTAATVFSTFFIIQLISTISGINIIKELSTILQEIVSQQVDMLTSLDIGLIDVKKTLDYLMMLLPALIIVQSMVGAFINYYLTSVIINRFKLVDYQLGDFSDFKLPGNIVFGSFIIFILSVMTSYIDGIDHNTLIANITVIFVMIFFLQGISFIAYLLKKSKTPKIIRITSVVLIVLITPLMTLVSLLGLFDSILNLRRINKKQ